jgi:hypothetical protein
MKRLFGSLLITLYFGLSSPVRADDLNWTQRWALKYSGVIAAADAPDSGLPSGLFERTMTAVLMQESSLCRHKHGKLDPGGYGCGQLHKKTAMAFYGHVLSHKTLLRDDALNIRLTGRYLQYCFRHTDSWERGLVCYNKGLGVSRKLSWFSIQLDSYVLAIRRQLGPADDLLAMN